MENELQTTRANRITTLHRQLGEQLRTTLETAIEIGELLTKQKADLEHGQWLPWLRDNAPFSERVARDYMRFYEREDELKTANLADLTQARKYLTKQSDKDNSDPYPFGNPEAVMRLIEGISEEWPQETPEEIERKLEALRELVGISRRSAQRLAEAALRLYSKIGEAQS